VTFASAGPGAPRAVPNQPVLSAVRRQGHAGQRTFIPTSGWSR
jgi:hypothetical protein